MELISCPDSAGRVMRIAEDKQFHAWVCTLFLKVIPIHFVGESVGCVYTLEWRFDDMALVVPYAGEEAVVDGRLHQYGITRLSESFDDSRDGGYYACCIKHPRALDFPSVTLTEPVDDGFIIIFGDESVAEDTVVKPLLQGIDDAWSGFEIHVGYP